MLLVALPAVAMAQDDTAANPTDEKDQVAQALADAKEVYGPPAPEPDVAIECEKERERSQDEIIVCAKLEDADRYRVGSSLDDGDDSHLQWLGDPPNLEPQYPGVVVARGCFIPPCPPPPVYYFDITALPEAPAGSDADKIAKGEMPAR